MQIPAVANWFHLSRARVRETRFRRWESLLFLALLCSHGLTGIAHSAQTKDTRFGQDRGFYSNSFDVVVSSATPGALITCTVDGSDPRTSPLLLQGTSPLTVRIDPVSDYGGKRPRVTPCVTLRAFASSAGATPSDVDTHTYIFLDRVKAQGNVVPGGAYVFWDTVMDPRVVTDPRYAAQFAVTMQDIPTLSVVMNWEDLFGTGGIHRGNDLNNHSLEKPCSAELIYPRSAKFAPFAGFQVNCGIKIQGGGGRWDEGLYDPKQSFTLLFEPKFGGPGRLKYPFFEAAPVNSESEAGEYNRIVLRSGHNKSWAGPGPNLRQTVVYTRDEYSRASQLAMSGKGKGSHGTFMHLYLNGIYWGLYNPAERPDHAFQSIHFGGDSEHYDSYKERNGDPNGDRIRLTAAQTLAADAATPYAKLQEYVDTAAFADYLIVTWASGAADGPQWYGGNARNPPGPVRFFVWDYEDSFTPPGTGRGGAGYTWVETNPLWKSIRSHPEFKMELTDRIYKHCFNDGVLTDAANVERWRKLADYIENAIIGESARWGDQGPSSRGGPDMSGYTPPLNRDDHWYTARDQVTALLGSNTSKLVAGLRSRGFFPSSNARAPLFFDGANHPIQQSRVIFTNSLALRIARDGNTGTIFWSTNGVDPRADGGVEQGLSGGTGTNLTIRGTTTVLARVRYGSEWSPVHVLTFYDAATDYHSLKITEIMYHPAPTEIAVNRVVSRIIGDAGGADVGRGLIRLIASAPSTVFGSGDIIVISGATNPANNGRFTVERVSGMDVYLDEPLIDEVTPGMRADMYLDGDRYEFIELQNTGGSALNVSGVRFTQGVEYEFPEGTILPPGKFWLLAGSRSNLPERAPGAHASGRYGGALDNAGERITLQDPFGAVIATVSYKDKAPWPVPADGLGASLVFIGAGDAASQDSAALWRSSGSAGGSPGFADPPQQVPPVRINEVLTHTDPPLCDAVELYNPDMAAVDLSGWHLTDDSSAPRRWTIPAGTSIPAQGYLVLYEGHYIGTNLLISDSEFGSEFSLSSEGEAVYLFSPALDYSHGFGFEAAFNGVSFGRYVAASGDEDFPSQTRRSLGAANAEPVIGPIVFSEVHYSASPEQWEFIELQNITDHPVELFDPAYPTNTWKVRGLAFEFPLSTTIPARGLLLLVRGNTNSAALFAARNGISPEIPIIPFEGALDDDGETLEILRPDEPNISPSGSGAIGYVVVDRLRYRNAAPWPEVSSLHRSLERRDLRAYGNDASNWRASELSGGTPGIAAEPPTTPLVAVHTTSLAVVVEEGTNPGLQELNVWNRGVGVLEYEITADASLAKVTPAAETSTGAGDRKLHYIELSTSQLSLGSYSTRLEIRATGDAATNAPVQISISISVVPRPVPELGFAPTNVLIQTLQGQVAEPGTLKVFNAGTGILNYEARSTVPWLTVVPAVGTSSGGEEMRTHSIRVTSGVPNPGVYVGWVQIRAASPPQEAFVPVILRVYHSSTFTSYNDLSWGAGQIYSNITTHTTSEGGDGSGGGQLLDYATGLPTGVTFSIQGGSWLGAAHVAQGRSPNPGTDAYDVFNGKVDLEGVLSYDAGDLLLTFSNLNAAAAYELVVCGSREAYADRFTTTVIEGAVSFTNRSTSGAEVGGAAGERTRILNGSNTAAGLVARYSEIRTGDDGSFALRVPASPDPRYYLNALMLRGELPQPPLLQLTRLSADTLLMTWEGQHLSLESATSPSGPWEAVAGTDRVQFLLPAEPQRFYRLRQEP